MGSIAAEAIARQPDITYTPDFAKYQARTHLRLQTETLSQTGLPSGYPQHLVSDLVWEGEGLAQKYDWIYKLTAEQIEELENALTHFKSLGKPMGYINEENFPLPNLHAALREISKELHFGYGFKVVRGLPVERHSREDNIIIYAGLSSHIAPLRARQDSKYDEKPADVVLNHIKDLSSGHEKAQIGTPAYTADKQVFHTDTGDIVSLFALSTAVDGGRSRLASTWKVYNELAATRPDLIETLSQDWIADNFGNANQSYTTRPLLFFQPATTKSPERIILQYARRYFTGFGALPRSTEIPPITEAQAEALDAIHFLGERFNVGLDFQRGDAQYVNNLAVFHARDGFKDSAEQQRHLVRLWLRDPEYAWETPEPLKAKWAQLYDGVTPDSQVFPLEPFVRSASKGIEKGKAESGSA
ncbi:Clavaminate synthase-like protein [Glonium stellatum]|uniref:Clavaminate synthase-like protein n=1 Tax=Glonium stellatum TaxID=574774 RepID=A0A8E2JMG1_9PEZI|nr:Clavaminate synthase-like protein [Glonium stellatum]